MFGYFRTIIKVILCISYVMDFCKIYYFELLYSFKGGGNVVLSCVYEYVIVLRMLCIVHVHGKFQNIRVRIDILCMLCME